MTMAPDQPAPARDSPRRMAARTDLLVVAAVAVGHLGFGLLDVEPGGLELLALEGLLLAGVALVGARSRHSSRSGVRVRRGLVLGGTYAAVVGLAWLFVETTAALWIAALSVLVIAALVSYGLHRYLLVSLDLVEPTDA